MSVSGPGESADAADAAFGLRQISELGLSYAAALLLLVYWRQGGKRQKVSHYEFRARRAIFDDVAVIENKPAWHCIQTLIQQRQEKIEAGFHKAYADLSLKPHKS